MRKRGTALGFLCLALALLWGCGGAEETGRWEVVQLHSASLGKDMTLQVCLPEEYDTGERCPVLYFLPGYGGSSYAVVNQFGLAESADRLVREGRLRPLILVALGMDSSFGVNSAETPRRFETASGKTLDEGRYEDYLIGEAIPWVEARYAADTDREGRFIGGYSMGGFAALHLALRHPELFSRVGGHSPSLFLGDFPDTDVSDWLYPDAAARAGRDPLLLAQSRDPSGLAFYLDTDEGGVNVEGCRALYEILTRRGAEAQFHLSPGTHSYAYCREYMDDYLLFYAGT